MSVDSIPVAVTPASRRLARRPARVALVLLMAAVLVACAPRNAFQFSSPNPEARVERVYVATARDLGDLGPSFGDERVEGLRYLHMDVSIPPTHQLGEIEWPKGTPDAATDFVVTDSHVYRGSNSMVRAMRQHSPGKETLVFVHGYNNTFSDAVYRFAQIRADFDFTGPGVLYSWPSAGDPRGYAYDRDSVLYSRDDFQHVLESLTAAPGERVLLLAHSMGAQLVMETLRQAALTGDRRVLDRISGVVLMAPDIDPDLFRRQAAAIGKLPQPFLIFVSRRDRVLSLSGLLFGSKPRLGVISGPEQLEGVEGVQVLDFTALGAENSGKGLGHAVPMTSPAAIRVLRGMIDEPRRETDGFGNFLKLRFD